MQSIRKSSSIVSEMLDKGFVPEIAHLFDSLDNMLSYPGYKFKVNVEKDVGEDSGFRYSESLGMYQSGTVTLQITTDQGTFYQYNADGELNRTKEGRKFMVKIELRAEVNDDGSVGETSYHMQLERNYDAYNFVIDEHDYGRFSALSEHINDLLEPTEGMIGAMGTRDPFWGHTEGYVHSDYEEAPMTQEMVREWMSTMTPIEIYDSLTEGSQASMMRWLGNQEFGNNGYGKHDFINMDLDDATDRYVFEETLNEYVGPLTSFGDIDALPDPLKSELYAKATEYWYSNHRRDYDMVNLSARKGTKKSVRKGMNRANRTVRKSGEYNFPEYIHVGRCTFWRQTRGYFSSEYTDENIGVYLDFKIAEVTPIDEDTISLDFDVTISGWDYDTEVEVEMEDTRMLTLYDGDKDIPSNFYDKTDVIDKVVEKVKSGKNNKSVRKGMRKSAPKSFNNMVKSMRRM